MKGNDMDENAPAELTEADLEAVVGAHGHCHCDHSDSSTGDGWNDPSE